MSNPIIYKYINNKNYGNVLFLHGFGQTKEMMMPLGKLIKKYANILIIDLPGNSNNPLTKPFDVNDYLDYIENILKEENFQPSLIVGHSFGGKLASFYTLRHSVPLLLLAPSSIKPPFSFKKTFRIGMYKCFKFLKKIKLVKNIPPPYLGSIDYQSTKGISRISFLKIVNSYLTKSNLKSIKSDVYIIYGKNDQQITYKQMKKFKKYCKTCHLIVIHGDHFAYLLNANAVASLILAILQEKK